MSSRPASVARRGRFVPRIVAAGDAALMLELADAFDLDANALAGRVAEQVRASAPDGVVDVVPGIVTVTVYFDAGDAATAATRRAALEALLREALERCAQPDRADERASVDIPVCYEPAFAPDLAEVAAATGLSPEEVVRRHTASAHRVLTMGFAPGFPYVGGLDARLTVPRRATPRARVEAGSVAIAVGQTAIYPFVSPGGWNLIGRTPLRLFDPMRARPSLVQAGDRIRFVPISAREFERLAAEAGTR